MGSVSFKRVLGSARRGRASFVLLLDLFSWSVRGLGRMRNRCGLPGFWVEAPGGEEW